MKLKVRIIFSIFIIIGILTISVVLPQFTPNSPQPSAQTTSTPSTPNIIITSTVIPPTIPETFAVEVSTLSHGIRLDIGVTDTTPRVGDTVYVVIWITNVNWSDPVSYNAHSINIVVLNSKGEWVNADNVIYPGAFPKEIPFNQTRRVVQLWKVETVPNYNVEVKPGESYDIVVKCAFWTSAGATFRVLLPQSGW
ncbi:MAG: hypothetical protein ACFFCW_26635 [Candidatus Hodarchaeota archaeon]